MYEVRAYHREDLFKMQLRKQDLDEMILMELDPNHLSDAYLTGPGFTLLYGDTILCAGGICPLWNGVGEVWWRGTVHIYEEQHKEMVKKTTREMLWFYLGEYNFHRVHTSVRSDWPAAVRFIEYMGFHRESLMVNWGPDKSSHYKYVILQEDK